MFSSWDWLIALRLKELRNNFFNIYMITRFFAKRVLAFLFFSFIVLQANAQITVKPGVRGGVNFSVLTADVFDVRPDVYLGGLAEIKLAKFYALQPEINYSRQGATANFMYDAGFGRYGEYDKDYSLQYLNINLINKFYVFHGLHALVGPSMDFKLSDNMGSDFGEEVRNYDIGLNLGIGYTFPIGLTIESRFKFGFLDVFGHDDPDYYDNYYNNSYFDGPVVNGVFQTGVTYTFDTKRK